MLQLVLARDPRVRVSLLFLTTCTPLIYSQSGQNRQPTPPVKKSEPAKAPAAKLTPEQERGLRLLKAAEAEAAGLAPDMKAFVLWRASLAYRKVETKKAEQVSADAFTATQAIEDADRDNRCEPTGTGSVGDIKGWIQERILTDLVDKKKIAQAEQLLPQAIEPVRNQTTKRLVQYYAGEKNFAHAQSLLNQLADTSQYPFDAAGDLILAMGPEFSADRMSIFSEAVNNFEQHKQQDSLGPNDIGDFIGRTWTKVPPAMALEAVTKLLEDAKTSDSKSHYSMASDAGSVLLNSDYEMRLFQLLPVLQEIDKDKAEELLRNDAETRAKLAKYPKGMQSLKAKGSISSFGVTDSDAPQAVEGLARDNAAMQLSERMNRIRDETAAHPEQAMADALGLPTSDGANAAARAGVLLSIAQATVKKNPRIAKSALDEMWKSQDQWYLARAGTDLTDLPNVYLQLGDPDGARKAISALVKSAEKLYDWDTNADDPNKSFKGNWPSSDMWRKCVQAAAKISPALAEEIIANIQDADIASAQKVAFASVLLGGGSGGDVTMVSDCRKTYAGFTTSVVN